MIRLSGGSTGVEPDFKSAFYTPHLLAQEKPNLRSLLRCRRSLAGEEARLRRRFAADAALFHPAERTRSRARAAIHPTVPVWMRSATRVLDFRFCVQRRGQAVIGVLA